MPTYNHCPPSSQEYCFNGGECFYLSDDPSVYICSCFMPFYGPQCEHEAPKSGTVSTITAAPPKEDANGAVRRSVDRAMTVTALIFIVVTFLGLLLLAWYLSRRRHKDYAQWRKIRQQSQMETKRVQQTMDRGVQAPIEESDFDRHSLYCTKQPGFSADIDGEQFNLPHTSRLDSYKQPNGLNKRNGKDQTEELEERRRSLEQVFKEIEPTEEQLTWKQSPDRSCSSKVPKNSCDGSDQLYQRSPIGSISSISDGARDKETNDNFYRKPSPVNKDKPNVRRSSSPIEDSRPVSNDQLKLVIEELSEMDQEDETAFPAQFNSTNDHEPQIRDYRFRRASIASKSNETNDFPTHLPDSSNQPPVTLDRASQHSVNEQYKLGMKRTNITVAGMDDMVRRYHTLTHVGRTSSCRIPPEIVHTTYVNAIDVQDLVHYTQMNQMHSNQCEGAALYVEPSVPNGEFSFSRSPCRTHTLPRPTVSPLWIETHVADRHPTPIHEPFTVASQHDALLSELYNRGSGDPLIPGNPDIA